MSEVTKVLKCNCKNEGQDSLYGKGMRLHNLCKAVKGDGSYRCTVCGNEKK